jgi:hypothetical protein
MVDTTTIERPFLGINGNRDWLFVTGRFKSFGTSSNISISGDRERRFSTRGSFTSSIFGGISIRGFGTDTVISEIFETVVHKTSFTSVVSVGFRTINELLFREIS